jgi:hypothetical protein
VQPTFETITHGGRALIVCRLPDGREGRARLFADGNEERARARAQARAEAMETPIDPQAD